MWENEQYLYRFLPLVHKHVQVIWVHTHPVCDVCVVWRVCVCVWRVCARALARRRQRLTRGRVWSVVLTRRHSYNNQSHTSLVLHDGIGYLHEAIWLADASVGAWKLRQHHASDHALRQALTPTSQSARTHHTPHTGCVCTQITWTGCVQEVKNDINTVSFSHTKPLVSCLRPSMCSYDGELLIWISLCMFFFLL